MATDIGRINAAIGGIKALDYQGPETRDTISRLVALTWAVKKDQAEREKARVEKSPDFLRCAGDYQDAPLGTTVEKRFGSGWWRKINDAWVDENATVMPGAHIAVAPRRVVKWGDA